MTASIIDGKARAARLRADVARDVARLGEAGIRPGLAVVLVGENPASSVYVRNKGKACREAGIESFEHRLSADTDAQELLGLIDRLNADPAVSGILVQLPLPGHIDDTLVLSAVDPAKDVDGFHVVNAGALATGRRGLVPCTPQGCLILLREALGDLAGREAVVIGRSTIVGRPMAQLLISESCTVTVAHSRTRDLPDVVRRGEIVVAAVGRAGFVQPDWLRPGATVIDVGINRTEEGLVGETAFVTALSRPARAVRQEGRGTANYAADYVMDVLDDFIGTVEDDIVVMTTIAPGMQASAERALADGFDRSLQPVQRMFLYMPFEHSESLADQQRSVALFRELGDAEWLDFARRHRDIVARFGRFPHRNAALGRPSTAEEQEFLKQPGSGF